MKKRLLVPVVLGLAGLPLAGPESAASDGAMLARAKSLELNTPYVPPPGDPLEHYASGYAKIMCSAVFITGLDPAFAAENVGYFTAPVRRAREAWHAEDRSREARPCR